MVDQARIGRSRIKCFATLYFQGRQLHHQKSKIKSIRTGRIIESPQLLFFYSVFIMGASGIRLLVLPYGTPALRMADSHHRAPSQALARSLDGPPVTAQSWYLSPRTSLPCFFARREVCGGFAATTIKAHLQQIPSSGNTSDGDNKQSSVGTNRFFTAALVAMHKSDRLSCAHESAPSLTPPSKQIWTGGAGGYSAEYLPLR